MRQLSDSESDDIEMEEVKQQVSINQPSIFEIRWDRINSMVFDSLFSNPEEIID